MMATETRPTSIGCHLRASVRSQMRPATWATPLSDAIQTAVAEARPDASKRGTGCAAKAPKTIALAAPQTAAWPAFGLGPQVEAHLHQRPWQRKVVLAGPAAALAPAQANPIRDARTKRLMAAKITCVVRHP
jgi:hypothetical protein